MINDRLEIIEVEAIAHVAASNRYLIHSPSIIMVILANIIVIGYKTPCYYESADLHHLISFNSSDKYSFRIDLFLNQ